MPPRSLTPDDYISISQADHSTIDSWKHKIWLPLNLATSVSVTAPDTQLAAITFLDLISYHGPNYSDDVFMFNPPPGVICSLGKLEGFLQHHVSTTM